MLEVFDRAFQKKAILHLAYNREEETRLNEVGSFSFSLPADDKKAAHCLPFRFIRNDGGDYYRLLQDSEAVQDVGVKTYHAEHGIATLVDDLMFGTHILGGVGVHTRDVLQYILNRQTVKHWTLGECDFDKQFEYGFESENLLNALFSVPNLFTAPYQWVYDMHAYPWTVHLKRIDEAANPRFYIRAGKNLIASQATRTATDICTRLYLLGYGEGDNQLTIKDVNGGLPYLQSPREYIDRYGLISKVYVDRAFEDAESLMERGKALLTAMQEPQYARSFQVADLYKITRQAYDQAVVGDMARLEMDGTAAYITKVARKLDSPGDMTLELSTTSRNVAETIADIADRQRIEQVYSQGATQIYSQSIQANADSTTPAVLNFFIPQEMRIINKVAAKISIESFRSYNRVTAGGGANTSTSSNGGGSQQTSQAAGASTVTSENGGDTTLTISSVWSQGSNIAQTEFASALVSTYTSSTGSASGTTGAASGSTGTNSTAYTSYNAHVEGSTHRHTLGDHTHNLNSHTHSGPSHTHSMTHTHEPVAHRHNMDHRHYMDHSHTVPGHTHRVSIGNHQHSVSIPAHNHTVDIPSHTHDIVQGIFRFGNPSGAQIQINSVTKGTMEREREIDLTPYLLNDSGKIPRGSWIRLGILPNDLAYVTIDIYVQGFVQSRGGGTY